MAPVTIPILAGIAQWLLWGYLAPLILFLFYPAVFVCALMTGLVGGLVATVWSIVIVWFVFVPPELSFQLQNPKDFYALAAFLVTGSLFSFFGRHMMAATRAEAKLAALVESEKQLRLMTAGIRDYAICMLDPSGHILTWNDGAKLLKGYGQEEIIGQSISIFFPAEDIGADTSPAILAEARKLGRCENEGWRVRKDGSRFYADEILTAIRDDSGQLLGFAEVTRDITERKLMEERLWAANQDLEQFAYIASHDLQEPLRMVSSYLQLIERRLGTQLQGEIAEFIAYAVDGAQRMGWMIHNLLEYSKVGGDLQIGPVDVGEVVAIVVNDLTVRIGATGAKIEVRSPLPTINGDENHLARLFQNLIGNAIKYCPAERTPQVSIGWNRQAEASVLWVRDNGIGIRPEDHERVFRMFQRLPCGGTDEGAGIGLAVCKKIVEKHGGRIWIESEPGAGSCFFMAFPSGPPEILCRPVNWSGENTL